jgi:predicted TPR repeat methyltransferase
MEPTASLGEITFSPGAEEWIEFGSPGARRRVGFHDYASLYGEPGLYERVFYEELGMRSADEVVGLYQEALTAAAIDPGTERVLDLGAGNGVGGDLLRSAGVGTLVGLDLEPMAKIAAERDRPGVYDEYLVADLAASRSALEGLRARNVSAVVAVSAIGVGHITVELLSRVLSGLLPRGGHFAFAVDDALLPGFHDDLFARVSAEWLGSRSYEHRRTVDGSGHPATAIVARLR